MSRFRVRKGNFFNQLTNSFDPEMADGNQYDLELLINDKNYYYRVRLIDGLFEAHPIKMNDEDFISSPAQTNCKVGELSSFFKTNFYRHDFEFKEDVEPVRDFLKEKGVFNNPDYYNFLKRVQQKNNLGGHLLYDFRIPAIERRKKVGVVSYDVSVEICRKYYYTTFLKENAENGFNQTDNYLYMIYHRPNFLNLQKNIEDSILELCLKNDYPINLSSLLYIICDGNKTLIKKIYNKIIQAKSKQDIKNIFLDPELQILLPSLNYDSELSQEFQNYIITEKDDINYGFSRKRI